MCDKSLFDILQFGVLVLTLIAIVWYTIIVKQQRDEMVRQRWISLLPKFTAELIRLENDAGTLVVTNIGNGTGTNIMVDNVPVAIANGVTIQVGFQKFLYLLPAHVGAERAELRTYVSTIEGGNSLDRTAANGLVGARSWHFSPPFPDAVTLTVNFDDIYDGHYKQTIALERSSPGVFRASSLGQPQRT